MAGYQLEYDALNELTEEFLVMNSELKESIKEVAKQIGNDLKAKTEANIPKRSEPKHGVHLADDVKLSVSATDKRVTITVKGGKRSGGYWFIVDNGHVAKNGYFVSGAHFTDKAFADTNVSEPVDKMIERLK